MNNLEAHIKFLFFAELQFRLASAVRIAVTLELQPLDLPIEWAHGSHRLLYEEIALTHAQGQFAASALHHTTTFTMAIAIKDAIESIVPKLKVAVRKNAIEEAIRNAIGESHHNVWTCPDEDVITAYHIARLIRNSFAHAPFAPEWMIQKGLQDKIFTINEVIELNTKDLHGTQFDWIQYGGPIAMFRFCRFVRTKVLGQELEPRKEVPVPVNEIYQQGNLIIKKIDESLYGVKKISADEFPENQILTRGL